MMELAKPITVEIERSSRGNSLMFLPLSGIKRCKVASLDRRLFFSCVANSLTNERAEAMDMQRCRLAVKSSTSTGSLESGGSTMHRDDWLKLSHASCGCVKAIAKLCCQYDCVILLVAACFLKIAPESKVWSCEGDVRVILQWS